MIVQDLMHPHPVTIQKDAPLATAAALLEKLEVRHLPVLDGTTLVGMLSDRDLGSVLQDSYLDPDTPQGKLPVANVMSSAVVVVGPEASAREAADTIAEHRVGALPVVRDGRSLVGIVSYVDLLKALAQII